MAILGQLCNPQVHTQRRLSEISLWISTLGGAYSALGDASLERAAEAERLAIRQYRVARALGDPGLAARCQLFVAWSWMQRGDYGNAEAAFDALMADTRSSRPQDEKFLQMCASAKHKLAWLRAGGSRADREATGATALDSHGTNR
jgi:hypothetical protein